MGQWRYIVQALPSGEFLEWDLPLSDVEITSELSGPGRLVGTVPIEIARLKRADGSPLLVPWGCAIWAEADGQIRGGGILVDSTFNGQSWQLDCVGLAGYAHGQPWSGPDSDLVQVDPLDVVRMVWADLQRHPDGDLGVVVDDTKSPVRVGTEPEKVEFTTGAGRDVAFDAGPFKLNWWSTHDVGKVVDDLASATPFDYVSHTAWDGERLAHRLELAYPRRGTRRTDLRFVVGENVTVDPTQVMDGDAYASEVWVYGPGEGRKRGLGRARKDRSRLRRVHVFEDRSVRGTSRGEQLAWIDLDGRTGAPEITDVQVTDSHLAELASLVVGDEVFIQSDVGWLDLEMWVRVLAIAIRPHDLSEVHLRVARSESVR